LDGLPDLSVTDRFQILRRIGAGGMGTVYEAVDRERNVHVALKALRNMDAASLLGFKNEFRDFQHLQHPNLVSIGELFSKEGEWFLTMELIDGVNFLQYVRPRALVRVAPSVPASTSDAYDDTAIGLVEEPVSVVPPPSFNEGRLRAALQQLALGLTALHAAHKVHRDVKPSNVLVSQQGRVVLVDFGLATDVVDRDHQSENVVVGTVLYMAPEQAAGRPVAAPADWYAVGVVLYEALTGQVPLSGPVMEVLLNKQHVQPASPRTINPNAPEDLDALCMDLLRFNPSERPTGEQVLQRLGVHAADLTTASIRSFSGSSFFVGRDRELAALRERFDASKRSAQIVALYGESGVGKSALVRRFAADLTERHGAVVLIGTCYERESVPFKAVDGLIDSLSRYMSRLSEAEAAALLPRRASLLAQVFPVLQRVEAFAIAPRRPFGEEAPDPRELRSRVFVALRELLGRLADRSPLVLVIDDLQWADADSFALLSEVLSVPDAPASLLLATVRTATEDEGAPELLPDMRAIKVGRLPASESHELAQALLRNARAPDGVTAEQVAREAGGHPLYIDELIRYASATGSRSQTAIQLDEALWARIIQLGPIARRVLELVCLSGSRLIQHTAARAAGIGFGDFTKQVAALRVAHLLRTTGVRSTDAVEPYHSRVRGAVLAHVSSEISVAHHRRLALALETSGQPDPEALTTHWREAGDVDKANHFAMLAAEKAEKAVAFDRAVRFYQLALQSVPAAEQPQELRLRLAHALENAGRGGEAGEAYLAAAETAEPAKGLELRRRAAEQLLISGHIDRGLEILHDVLAAVRMKIADTPRQALMSLLVTRAKLRLRGLGFRERSATQISSDALTRIDVCWSAGISLALVDSLRGADFHARSLLFSLRAGEPYRISRSLAMGSAAEVLVGEKGAKRAAKLHQAATELADRVGNPHASGLVRLMAGIAAFLQGHWRIARDNSEAAGEIFREHCTGVAWELDNASLYPLWSRIFLGELQGLGTHASQLLANARLRGDLYLETNLKTRVFNMSWLAADRPDRAQADVEAGIKQWSQKGFHLQNYFALQSLAEIELYRGDGGRAQALIEPQWAKLSRSDFFLVQMMRIEMRYLRARCALATAKAIPAQATKNLATAIDQARALDRERARWAAPLAQLIRGSVLAMRGERSAADAMLASACARFEEADMWLHAMCVRRRLGDHSTADRWMALAEVADPVRMTDLIAP
jgi:serine/threonine protein kinase